MKIRSQYITGPLSYYVLQLNYGFLLNQKRPFNLNLEIYANCKVRVEKDLARLIFLIMLQSRSSTLWSDRMGHHAACGAKGKRNRKILAFALMGARVEWLGKRYKIHPNTINQLLGKIVHLNRWRLYHANRKKGYLELERTRKLNKRFHGKCLYQSDIDK